MLGRVIETYAYTVFGGLNVSLKPASPAKRQRNLVFDHTLALAE